MIERSKKTFFLILGILTTLLAFVGVILPILPTTPFLLLSAYFFSKSSNRLYQWILEHRIFGPIISNWEKHGVISFKAKVISISMMALLFTYSLITIEIHLYIKAITLLSGIAVALFIATRPSTPNS